LMKRLGIISIIDLVLLVAVYTLMVAAAFY